MLASLQAQFDDVPFDAGYFSSSAIAPFAFIFVPAPGFQSSGFQVDSWYAVDVRPGDVFASAAPEPGGLALLLAGLGLLAAWRWRRTH